MPDQIHWHEGLFLQPHHLQILQRSTAESLRADRRLAWPYSYGVVEAELLYDELEDMRVRFKKLRAIMPSGVEVNYPESADLPSLDIKSTFARGAKFFDVFLGVPLWTPERANTFRPDQEPDSRAKLIYKLKELSRMDENTGDNPKDVQFRAVNARLMLDTEDRADMEILPLLRIKRGVGEEGGLPRLDPEFAYPSMVLNSSPALRDLVRALASQSDATRDEVDRQLHNGGIGEDRKMELTLRLVLLGRFCARMNALTAAPNIPLYMVYLEMRSFLGELAALRPGQAVFTASPYDHDNPYPAFKELDSKLRREIKPANGALYKAPFEKAGQQNTLVYVATLKEEHFVKPSAYYLGVKTKADPTALTRLVEDGNKFKLMPQSMSRVAIFGIPLKGERNPPLELPNQAGLYYFLLQPMENPTQWSRIQSELSMAVTYRHADLDMSDAEFVLYMPLSS